MLIPVLMSLVVGEPDAMGLTGTLFTFGFVLFFGGCSAYLAGRFFPVRAEKPLPGGDEKSQRSTA